MVTQTKHVYIFFLYKVQYLVILMDVFIPKVGDVEVLCVCVCFRWERF